MTEREILLGLKEVLAEKIGVKSDLSDVCAGRPFKEIHTIDSVTLLKILVALEKRFRITFDIDSLDKVFRDIHSIARYLVSKKSNG